MNEYIKRARERFNRMKTYPAMYTRYKEAFLAEVTGIMAVLDPEFEVALFCKKHCRKDPKDSEIDAAWCTVVVDDVLGLPVFEKAIEVIDMRNYEIDRQVEVTIASTPEGRQLLLDMEGIREQH